MKLKIASAVWGMCLLVACQAPVQQTAFGVLSDDYVYEEIVFDFPNDEWRFGPNLTPLSDCSNDDYFCAKIDRMPFSIPKKCSVLRDTSTWSHDGNTMKVIARWGSSKRLHNPPPGVEQEALFIVNEAKAGFVIEYHIGEGITAFFYDPYYQTDVFALAESNEPNERYRHNLVTRPAMAACIDESTF